VSRILLLVPTRTYRTADFIEAARRLGIEVVIGTDRRPALAELMPEPPLVLDLARIDESVRRIAADAAARPYIAIVAVDDGGSLVAAGASARLGLPHNPPEAVAISRDKARSRQAFSAAGLPTPRYRVFPADADPDHVARAVAYPAVVKPTDLSASRGVIRANDPAELAAAFRRVAALVSDPAVCRPGETPQPILVEDYVPGREVAVEGLLRGGRLEVLAIFDKPDPLEGPFFEETYFVTPSRLELEAQRAVREAVDAATAALGLREGPIHAEARLNEDGAWVLEVAARSIGGLCARTLRFGAGISLEDLILRHAAGMTIPDEWLVREDRAAGVLMLPIARGGILREVRGIDAAREVPGIEGLQLTVPLGDQLVPLPEGDRYLGFLFARARTPAAVEHALRQAHARLEVIVDGEGSEEPTGSQRCKKVVTHIS
jgi:biotin carboxylase